MRDPLASYIDHTNLSAAATEEDIRTLCREAIEHQFVTVCVAPYRVGVAAACLESTDIRVGTVIGFPMGADHCDVKIGQAARAIEDGATEIDMVMNVGAACDGHWDVIRQEIGAMQDLCAQHEARLKIILETALLTDAQKIEAANICLLLDVDYVKTSTGVTGGATVQDLRLLREVLGDDVGIKASGGIWDRKTALTMIEAGATRIGTSHGVDIILQGRIEN